MRGVTTVSKKSNVIEKVIRTAAKAASESASLFCLYEPQMPAELIKPETKTEEK